MKKSIVIIPSFFIVAIGGIYAINYTQLQSKMNTVLKEDYRNSGIDVSVHYSSYVSSSTLVYDLKTVSGSNSPADVFRVLLQFANRIADKKFNTVELCFKGKAKFKLDGDYFQTIGKEYSLQNPVYTMRTFPENLKFPDGRRAYSEWTGGWLGVAKQQLEDFNDFHKKWYLGEF